ncbi:hydantoinase B/oxoprolinase family protein [Verminephrobacter eiseniae]|uniref:5-oxoprolinase (ATP-hydrolyzing) n=1 Tax=Verminephrobacter eiseniae (strain EF01-2) TaxID=391735 RepID=A1WJ58_VEREI|nr:hydantoinase B/oxoprolinase family protein [Verminephrobacter eiseniae]ABM57665.1 5-oxoprolinase (ATP-hydrolyzing) [Verminephrobacter eiseniae EF01-2]MCW5283283.1 hydantoinase B/oxoprolinase family protein [Verminephrobacter eiseniae]MCW5303599.1 hydantoinase B/oxoprolinase family protein [Verminephrobacter eiseniae]MCW8179986.1 hydantoinase B/oxoprolinase family protein [Verminephrobacter eiseniae]MCW8188393.1 hydantoinase B/oxoprolinase family protein [Verminephrobacter eiseniae]
MSDPASAIDPVTLAVLRGRLEQVADEMDATLYRSAFNPIIAEAHDACHGLYDASTGDTLVQGKSGLPVFVGAMAFAVRATARVAASRGGMKDGDIWISNDAYDGGTHANDFKLVKPFFRGAKLYCHMASAAHWHDVGGAVPGNYNPAATECWQEAVQIPPVRIVRNGVLDPDMLAILQANTRLPDSLWGDLNGQLAALALGARRLDALLDEYGDGLVLDALGALRGRALRLMRSHIAALPDGRYSFEDVLDNDGIVNAPLTIALDMTVAGDRLSLDFSRTCAQCAGPVNISRATAVAACYVALKHLFPDVPANAGVLDAVDFIIPDRLLISAERPRPVGGYTETILRMIDVIFSAAAQADPARAVAQAYGTINALSIAGHRSDKARAGQRWVMFSFFGGGHGGHSDGDGLAHGNAPISTATIPPLEILEAAYPVRFTQWSLRADSGGDGQHRGGLGAVYEIELLEKEAEVFVFGERGTSPPKGIAGGGAGAVNVLRYENAGQWHTPPMVSKMRAIRLARGERVRLETPGGGGWGSAAGRSPGQRQADVAMGYVTIDASTGADRTQKAPE